VVDAPGGNIPGPSFQDARIIGDKGYTAPKPLGISPLAGMRSKRIIRPEFEDAQQNLGQTSSRITMDEYLKRKDADVGAAKEIASAKGDINQQIKLKQAELDMLERQAMIQSQEKGADYGAIASDYNSSATAALKAPPLAGNAPKKQPINVEVSDDEVIESDPTGTVVRGSDGRVYFIPKGSNERRDVTDQF